MSDTIQNPVSNSSNNSSENNNNKNNNDNSSNNNRMDTESFLSKQHDQISTTPTSSSPFKNVLPIKNSTNNTKRIEKKSASSNIIKINEIKQAKIVSSKRKSKKGICFYPNCTKTIAKFIGDCNFCSGHFCSGHRLMESHNCKGLATCKEQLHKRNADKLTKEQTIVSKIQI